MVDVGGGVVRVVVVEVLSRVLDVGNEELADLGSVLQQNVHSVVVGDEPEVGERERVGDRFANKKTEFAGDLSVWGGGGSGEGRASEREGIAICFEQNSWE